MDWFLELLPYEKYAGYIVSAYGAGFVVLAVLVMQSVRAKGKIIKQLQDKYKREQK